MFLRAIRYRVILGGAAAAVSQNSILDIYNINNLIICFKQCNLHCCNTPQASNLLLTSIFVPLTLVLSLGLIRPIKGAVVGAMLTFNMLKSDAEAG